MKQWPSKQFLRFVLANSLAALTNIITRLTSSLIMLDTWAVAAGFCAGMLTSYVLCRRYVFQSIRRASLSEILRFTGINLIALVITWCVYYSCLKLFTALHLGSASNQAVRTSAHTLGVVAPVLFSFVAQKSFTFRQNIGSHRT